MAFPYGAYPYVSRCRSNFLGSVKVSIVVFSDPESTTSQLQIGNNCPRGKTHSSPGCSFGELFLFHGERFICLGYLTPWFDKNYWLQTLHLGSEFPKIPCLMVTHGHGAERPVAGQWLKVAVAGSYLCLLLSGAPRGGTTGRYHEEEHRGYHYPLESTASN